MELFPGARSFFEFGGFQTPVAPGLPLVDRLVERLRHISVEAQSLAHRAASLSPAGAAVALGCAHGLDGA
jgi:hypothetical protein